MVVSFPDCTVPGVKALSIWRHRILNLLVTPHAAWYSEESLLDLQRLTARAIVELYQSGTTANLVNQPA